MHAVERTQRTPDWFDPDWHLALMRRRRSRKWGGGGGWAAARAHRPSTFSPQVFTVASSAPHNASCLPLGALRQPERRQRDRQTDRSPPTADRQTDGRGAADRRPERLQKRLPAREVQPRTDAARAGRSRPAWSVSGSRLDYSDLHAGCLNRMTLLYFFIFFGGRGARGEGGKGTYCPGRPAC